MKKLSGFVLGLLTLLLPAAPAYSQQLAIQLEGGKQIVFEKADIQALPHMKITVNTSHVSGAYEGVDLEALLEKAGVSFGESLKGKRMASCLLVEAADEYRVVIALPEMDPAFTERHLLLVFLKDGRPLDDKEGPYRIIIPNEKRMARWVRQVTALKIVDVQ